MFWVLTFNNIRTFFKSKFILFLFIIISQIVCIIAVFTVAGLIDAATPEPKDERNDYMQKTFHVNFTPCTSEGGEEPVYYYDVFDEKEKKFLYTGTDEEEYKNASASSENTVDTNVSGRYLNIDNLHTFKEIKSKINEVIQFSENEVLFFEIWGYTDDTQNTVFLASGGEDKWLMEYRSEVYGNDHKIYVTRNPYAETPFQKLEQGDKITIGSTEYKVAKIKEKTSFPPDSQTSLQFMYNAIDDSFKVSGIELRIEDSVDQSGIAKIQKKIDEVFRDDKPKVQTPEPKPLLEKQFNNMIYVLSFIMVAVVILNISRLYTFIMSTRKKSLAVFSICGASKVMIFAIYILEIFISLLISFVLGLLIFRFGLIGIISSLYPSFLEFFTFKIYLMIFGIYMTVGLIVMTANIIPVVNKSITDLKKG